MIENAKERIKGGLSRVINKRGSAKYIKNISVTEKLELDEEKIKEDEKWDGFYGIETSCKYKDPKEILNKYYHSLWRIEESFRIFKSHLEARPIFHWTPKRIKGHFVLCFIAFLFERTIEIELKKKKIEYSPSKIRKALDDLEVSEIEIENQKFCIRSKVEALQNDILRTFKIKIPPSITKPELF